MGQKEQVIEAMESNGGCATFKQLNQLVDVSLWKAKDPAANIRRIVQTNDEFFKIKPGLWGLVDYTLDNIGVSLTQDDETFSEGKIKMRQHLIRERNTNLIKKAKEKFKSEHDDKLFCEICEVDFSQRYGELGKDFIEAHHIKPVSEMQDGEETSINGIVMLCSNCHSMVHRRKPWLKREELKSILKNSNSI